MKIHNLKYLFIICFFASFDSISQVQANGAPGDQATSTSAFINASGLLFSSDNGFTADGSGNEGKGLVFPRTDLTTFTFTTLLGADYPTFADGMIVYNITSGTTPASGSGIGNQDVETGFYYFSNPGLQFDTSNGQWIPMDTDTRGETIIETNTINESVTIINTVPEKVVIVPGDANGTTTELVLDDSGLTNGPLSVNKLREAKVYDATGTELLLIASGRYETATNTLVTGDGMVNKLLPAGTYQVELYFE